MDGVNYFHDGYTQEGFIAAVPRLHGELRFSYRPALVEERSQLSDLAARMKSHLYDRQVAHFVAGKLVSWDLADPAGAEVGIAAESLLRLHPELFAKLQRIVLGCIACDVDPSWPGEQQNRLLEEASTAAASGRTVGGVRAEYDEKN
jgi:hypothetical protein